MSFLSPWALGLAAAAALPVLLHLLRRNTRKRLAFPAIRYLRQARERSARRLELRDRMLLMVRVGLVSVIAVAAAGPLLGRGGGADHEPSDIALVIDNSGSMSRLEGDSTLLDRQRERARELLREAGPDDRFWVLPAVGPVRAHGVAAGEATRAVSDVRLTDAAADLGASTREALRLLPPSGARPREIVLMSDFQASSGGPSTLRLPEDVRLVASRAEASVENTAVTLLRIEPPAPGAGGVALVGLGPPTPGAANDTIDVRLDVDGETVALARADADGAALLAFAGPGPGEHVIEAGIGPSGVRSDDRRAAVYRSYARPVVRRLGPGESHLGRALATLEDAGRLSVAEGDEREAAAWVVEGVPPADPPASHDATWILAPPDEEALLARFNAWLERLGVPWAIDVADTRGSTELPPLPEVPGLESVRVRSPYRLRPLAADSTIVRTGDGNPWLVAGRVGPHRYLLLGSPLVEAHTDLPVTAAMVPFVETLLFRWAGLGGALPEPVEAGVAVPLPADADSVRAPDGESVRVDGGDPFVPLLAGVYTVFRAGGGSSLLAATVPAAESDLRPLEPEQIGPTLGASDAVVAASEAEWRRAMFGSRRGAPVTAWLLAVALALACVEGLLAVPRARPVREAGAIGGLP